MAKMKKIVTAGRQLGKTSFSKMIEAAVKAGYYSSVLMDVNYSKMADDRKWLTKEGKILKYAKMDTEHIESILAIFEEGKFIQRLEQERGLREELLSRQTQAGKVLYGTK